MTPRASYLVWLLLASPQPQGSRITASPSNALGKTMKRTASQLPPAVARRPISVAFSGLTAIAGACLIAGCPGVQVLTDGTAPCSPEALAETRRLKIPYTASFGVEVLGLPGSGDGVAIVKEGPIELRVTQPVLVHPPWDIQNSPLCADEKHRPKECEPKHRVSYAGLLYGEARFKGDRVYIRIHQLRDYGRIGPFCAVVAQTKSLSQVGLAANPLDALRALHLTRPPPGTALVWARAEVLLVDDETQAPKSGGL